MIPVGYYKIPSGYLLRVNMTSDTFIEEADGWRRVSAQRLGQWL